MWRRTPRVCAAGFGQFDLKNHLVLQTGVPPNISINY